MHSVVIAMNHGKQCNAHGIQFDGEFLQDIQDISFSPKCRVKVTGKKKNFVINGILDAYLKAHPNKRPAPKEPDEDTEKAKRLKNDKHEVCFGEHISNRFIYICLLIQVGPDGMYLYNTQYDGGSDDEYEDNDEPEVNFLH